MERNSILLYFDQVNEVEDRVFGMKIRIYQELGVEVNSYL